MADEIKLNVGNETPDSTGYFRIVLGALGSVYGLYFAYNKNSGFWGYIGWMLLFGTGGNLTGMAIDATVKALKK